MKINSSTVRSSLRAIPYCRMTHRSGTNISCPRHTLYHGVGLSITALSPTLMRMLVLLLLHPLLLHSSQPMSPANLYSPNLDANMKPVHCTPFRKSENSFCDDTKCFYPKSVADCSGNGQCLAPSGMCKCKIGFEGDDCSIKSSPCVSGQVTRLTRPRGYFTDGSPPPPSSSASNAQSGYRTDLNCTWAINPLQSSGEFSFPVAIVVECVVLSALAVIPFFDCLTGTWTSS
jgi:hypothetical protein